MAGHCVDMNFLGAITVLAFHQRQSNIETCSIVGLTAGGLLHLEESPIQHE